MKFLDWDDVDKYFFITILLCAFLLIILYTLTMRQRERKRFLILRSYNVVSIPDHLAKLPNYKWQALVEDAQLKYKRMRSND